MPEVDGRSAGVPILPGEAPWPERGHAALAHVAPSSGGGTGWWVGILALLGLAVLVAGYGLGVRRLWSRHGPGHGVPGWRVAAFAAGVAVLLASQSPPVDAAAGASFAAHMGQHMLLLVVAAPLFAAGGVGLAVTMSLARRVREWLARVRASQPLRWLRTPVPLAATIWLVQAAVLWGWHLPVMYEATLRNDVVHVVEHGCFLGASWLLWAPILGAGRHAFSGPAAVGVVFVAGVPAVALGALFAFAPVPLYPDWVLAPAGGDPLSQQQLAGMIMWIPMNVVYLLISAVALLRWLIHYERRMPSERELRAPEWDGSEIEEVGV